MESRVTSALKIVALIVLSLSLVAGGVEVLRQLGNSGIVIMAAVLITYLILPLVGFLQRRMPLALALLLTYVAIGVILAFAFVVIVPPLVSQAHQLISNLPSAVTTLQQELSNPENPIVKKLPPDVRTYIDNLPAQLNALVAKYGLGVVQGTLGAFFSIVTLFLSLILIPVLSAYLFFDAGELKRSLLGFVPAAARPKTLAILADLNTTLGAFVQGQALDGLILGSLITIMLAIMHVPYALLIGVAAGILNLIPYVGAIIGFIPSVILALIYNGWENALIVGILFGVLQQIDGNVILPRVMKTSVQLSPLIIVIAILIFSAFFGVMGTFLAVPVTAMFRVFKLHFAPAPNEKEYTTDEQQSRDLRELRTRASTTPG